jgi:hypothetical protein
VVSFQPYYDSIAGAKQGIEGFIDTARARPANAATRFLIYSAWPAGTDPNPSTIDHASPGEVQVDFQQEWINGVHTMTRPFFTQLVTELREENPGVTIDMVPVGDVLYELDQRLAASPVGGISSVAQLYRDGPHMGGNGQRLAAMTFYATLHGEHPSGGDFSSYASDSNTASLMPLMEDTVWDVVTTHPFTSVPEPRALAAPLAILLILRRRRTR